MKIAVCIDKNNGVLFCGRRLSQDRALREKLLLLLPPDGKLYTSFYSAKQFENQEAVVAADNFLELASPTDICFLEDEFLDFSKVSAVYLFQWNRDYPADVFFEFDAKALGFAKTATEDFSGNSHKKITLTVYERK